MFIGRIVGTVVATQKVRPLTGHALFVVEPLRIDQMSHDRLTPTGRSFVCVDTIGAGEGDTVLCVQGSSARYTEETKTLPIDAAIVGLVDTVTVADRQLFGPDSPDRTPPAPTEAADG